ncbi:MAG: flotillin family protein [Betaproteobacteria bacterium]
MSASDFGIFLLGLVAVAIVVAIVVWLLHWLYLRSSKERSFVRTGLGGQKVVLGGGAFVLPIVHDVIPVNMNTLRLEVARGRDKALITKDRMRVDVMAEFYVRVQASAQAVADAAQTLGTRTLEPEKLRELLEGKFVDALRTVAAETTMEDLHEKRGEYVRRVRGSVAEDLLKNGLELEAASLTQLDQTGMEFFNPSNAFDAEGLTRLTEQIERRKKQRNEIEQDTMISIRTKNLEAEKLALDIDREAEHARLMQEREVEIARARQRADLASERAGREQEAERAGIAAREAVERAKLVTERKLQEERIAKERELQALEIQRRKELELAEQQRAIAVAEQSKAESEARAAADQARARAVAEEERVFTAREVEMAERAKHIQLIEAQKEGEREGLRLRLAAEAEKLAAGDRGAALRAQAEAEADAEKIRALAVKIRHEIDAEGTRLMNEAQNVLSPEARLSALRLRLVEKMEGIIRESVKPMERIEGIKILHVDGLGGGHGGGSYGNGEPGGHGLADSVVNSALRFRAQAPLVDQLLREIGVQGGEIGQIAQSLSANALPAVPKAGE